MMRDNTSQTHEQHQQQQPFEVPLIKALGIATRPQHARLNHLVLSRLPLALPPHTDNPDAYANGLLQFASIYYAFESAWQILSDYEPMSELPLETAVVLSSLIHLHIPTLPRTERLINDLAALKRVSKSNIAGQIRHPSLPKVIEFMNHIRETARAKPHALIAYPWVLYMALFNGGRWIREQLATAKDISWVGANPDLASKGLSLWHFESTEDGDDIKEEFKTRLTDVGAMLGSEHKEDIIDEAKTIFERCAEMVQELDDIKTEPPSEALQEVETAKWTRLHDFLSMLLPMVIMQLLMLMVQRISGARIRSPLPFRKFDRKDD